MMFFQRCPVSAAVADGALIVRTGGDRPRLWRGSLTDAASATLEVREGSDGKVTVHRLVLVRADGTPDEIAVFTSKQHARHAFRVVSDRLMRGVAAETNRQRPWILRFLAGIAKVVLWTLFLLMLLFVIIAFVNAPREAGLSAVDGAPAPVAAAPANTSPPAGVPVPAEQLFGE